VIAQLKEKGKVTRGWIGVQSQGVTSDIAENLGLKEARGALVAAPQANGPAIKAGIEAGDVITAVNGTEVSDSREFARTISGLAPGSEVDPGAQRRGENRQCHARGTAESARGRNNSRYPGATWHEYSAVWPLSRAKGRQRRPCRNQCESDGLAAEYGFKTGDVILEMAGKKVASAAEVRNAIAAAEKSGKRTVLLRLKSGDNARYLTVPLRHG